MVFRLGCRRIEEGFLTPRFGELGIKPYIAERDDLQLPRGGNGSIRSDVTLVELISSSSSMGTRPLGPRLHHTLRRLVVS